MFELICLDICVSYNMTTAHGHMAMSMLKRPKVASLDNIPAHTPVFMEVKSEVIESSADQQAGICLSFVSVQ